MTNARSLLFLPALRADRLFRAQASGADMVCIDLEDSVPPSEKTAAREAASSMLQFASHGVVGVRINSTPDLWETDAKQAGRTASFVMVPKAESARRLGEVFEVTGGRPLWPIIESGTGMMSAQEVATAPGVQGVLFGAFDYAADVGCELEWEPLLFARSQLAAACACAHVQLLDAPFGDLRDPEGLETSTRRSKALGFTGRSCIHPDQIATVNSVYTPTDAELAQAQRILAAFDGAASGAAQLEGRLIELPVALAARRVLARARQ